MFTCSTVWECCQAKGIAYHFSSALYEICFMSGCEFWIVQNRSTICDYWTWDMESHRCKEVSQWTEPNVNVRNSPIFSTMVLVWIYAYAMFFSLTIVLIIFIFRESTCSSPINCDEYSYVITKFNVYLNA